MHLDQQYANLNIVSVKKYMININNYNVLIVHNNN